ncbi:MAG TPA: amidohydrolase family protein [Ramlibacter sp.]|nr:amidohydrolase family protein [Ramlibacter sp.]
MSNIRLSSTCACGIDVHAHVVPERFPTYLGSKAPADWPSMAPAQPCHRNVMISGKVYRTVVDKCWDTGKRLQDLPGMGLALQVVSPMPELLSYWMGAADAQQLLRCLNEQIAAMVADGGGALASLLPRLQQGWGVFPALRDAVQQAPIEQARRLFYDTLVFDAPTLRHLVASFGDTQLLVGTDYPFNFHDHTPVQRIEASGFDDETLARLVHRNAERFLGLPTKHP